MDVKDDFDKDESPLTLSLSGVVDGDKRPADRGVDRAYCACAAAAGLGEESGSGTSAASPSQLRAS